MDKVYSGFIFLFDLFVLFCEQQAEIYSSHCMAAALYLGPTNNYHVTCFSVLDKLKLELKGKYGLSMAADTFP